MCGRLLAGCVLWSLFLCGVAEARPPAETEELKVFDVAPGARVRISNQDGPVRVNIWQQPQVRMIARRRAQAWSRETERKLRELMQVRAEKRGPDVFIEGRSERFASFGWISYSLELEVTVPRKTDVEVRSNDGSIALTGVEGSIDARTRDGHIEARQLTGELSLSTNDGSLTLDEVNGRVRAATSDGAIRYRGLPERLELRTSDGHIRAEILPGARMAGNWTLRTFDGSIDLLLPPDFDANLDAETQDGRVLVEYSGASAVSRSRSRFSGKLNAGGYLLTVHTNNGSIRVSMR